MKHRNTTYKWIAFLSMLFVWLFCLSAAGEEAGILIDETNFPDADFREIVKEYDKNNNGFLSEGEIAEVDSLYIEGTDVKNMEGIKFFTSLSELICRYNYSLVELDISGCKSLTKVECSGNCYLKKLDISGCTALKEFDCSYSYLTVLDVSECTALENLNCSSNWLTALDVNGCTALKVLDCVSNNLTALDVSECKALKELFCESNKLTALDISECKALKELYCGFTDLTVLDVSECTALKELDCSDTDLTVLDVSGCTALKELDFSYTHLTTLDVSECTALEKLDCRCTDLTVLDVSECTALKELNCSGTDHLTNLNVGGCTALENLYCGNCCLTALDVSGCTALEKLICSDNKLTALNVSGCAALKELDCCDNELTELDLSQNTSLKYCYCELNNLKNLDVSNCTVLSSLVKQEKRKRDRNDDMLWDEWKKQNSDGCQAYLSIDTNVEVTAGDCTSMPLPSTEETIKAFINRCYRIILNRESDITGLNTWLNELTSGRKTASEIIDRFVNSPEYLNKHYSYGESVDILYQTMLDRSADPAGKTNWVEKLENGQTLAHIINGFSFSMEFRHLCYVYGIQAGFVNIPNTETTTEGKIRAFIQRCYRIILDREADPGGVQTWYEQLSLGKKTAAEMIDRFVNSPEFSGKKYSWEEIVEILYKAMLGRRSDAAGKANWVSKLDAGQPFVEIFNGFCISKEFNGICASYGIKPGFVTIPPLIDMEEEELSMLALNAKAPITRRSEAKPNRVEIINPSDTIDMNIGTAVQAVYINEEKTKEFIGRCYRVILGRNASAAELENWIGQMVNGTKSPDQIARGFLFSNEFKAKNIGNEDLVKILYRVYMNRDADPEGLKTWTEKLENGTSLNDLLNAISKTNEFKKVGSEMSK